MGFIYVNLYSVCWYFQLLFAGGGSDNITMSGWSLRSYGLQSKRWSAVQESAIFLRWALVAHSEPYGPWRFTIEAASSTIPGSGGTQYHITIFMVHMSENNFD